MFVAFIQHATPKRHVVICGLRGSTVFINTISQTAKIRKRSYWTWNACFEFLYKCVWNISHSNKNWERYDEKCILVFM